MSRWLWHETSMTIEPFNDNATIESTRLPTLVSGLPTKLKLQIIQDMFIPQQPCAAYIFKKCDDATSCSSGQHVDTPLPFNPDFAPSGIIKLFYEKGKDNILQFDQTDPFFHNL